MITDNELLERGFVQKDAIVDEYQHTYTEHRWYYGPYIYLVKCDWDDERMTLYVDIEKYSDVVSAKICIFTERDIMDDVVALCKDWYMCLNRKFIREIEKLQDKRDEIMNYVF